MRSLDRSLLVSVSLAALVTTASARQLLSDFAKDVAAPPSDIVEGRLVAPAPSDLAVASRAHARPLYSRWSESDGWIVEADISVDADGPLALAILTPGPVEWSWTLTDPSGVALDLAASATRERRASDATGSRKSAGRAGIASTCTRFAREVGRFAPSPANARARIHRVKRGFLRARRVRRVSSRTPRPSPRAATWRSRSSHASRTPGRSFAFAEPRRSSSRAEDSSSR